MTLKTLPDLFRRCREQETGHWRVGSEQSRTVHLESGDIVFASSNFPSDRLTTILVERGKLTQSQMDHAMTNLKPGLSVGKNLIEMGFITQRDLLDVARLMVERIVWSALVAPETPTFESRSELEENIVKLPLDTPSLLFAGIMRITDRESLLELLGPLYQVVFLQGKRVYELDLPTDLAKMAPLMDGTHTILELSSEAAVEPMRTGAFALFLREMGWGKLYELPPLDRQALDRALDVPDPTRPPSSIPSPRSMLFTTIEEAAKPTTNLEHLSSMLDDIENLENINGQPEPLYNELEEVAQKTESKPPQVKPPEPKPEPVQPKPVGRVLPLPPEFESLEKPLPPEEPSIVISRDDNDSDNDSDGDAHSPAKAEPSGDKGWIRLLLRIFVVVAIILAISAVGYLVWRHLKQPAVEPPSAAAPADSQPSDPETASSETTPTVPPEPNPISATPPQPTPSQSTSPKPTPSQPTPSQSTPSQPTVAERVVDASKDARFRAIADGDTEKALAQGRVFQANLPRSSWTIRLIVACQNETLQNCARILGATRPDFFLTPIRLRDGRLCYQLFLGSYPNQNATEAEIKKLLTDFKDRSLEPKAMQIKDIAARQ